MRSSLHHIPRGRGSGASRTADEAAKGLSIFYFKRGKRSRISSIGVRKPGALIYNSRYAWSNGRGMCRQLRSVAGGRRLTIQSYCISPGDEPVEAFSSNDMWAGLAALTEMEIGHLRLVASRFGDSTGGVISRPWCAIRVPSNIHTIGADGPAPPRQACVR